MKLIRFGNKGAEKPGVVMGKDVICLEDEAGFITGSFYPIDGGFITLNM